MRRKTNGSTKLTARAFTLIELPAMRNLRPCSGRAGFTLIELLVVVTIIVVLLALLVPAMDKAIYQAQLAVCSAQQKTVGYSAINYALDHKRHYPYRPAVDNVDSNWQAVTLYHHPGAWGAYDDRPTLRPYMDINKILNDPLVTAVVLDNTWDQAVGNPNDAASDVVASVSMWFGYRYEANKGMHKIGDRWTYGKNQTFDILVGDRDVVGGPGSVPNPENDPTGWATKGTLKAGGVKAAGAQCSHPDKSNILTNTPIQDGVSPWGGANLNLTISYWWNLNSFAGRGLVDTNYTYQDLSVHRFNDVKFGWDKDERMTVVQTFVNKSGGPQLMPKH